MSGYMNTPEGVLVRIKNKLSLALGVNPPTLKLLIDRYVSMNSGRNSSKAHFDKVNAYDQLSGEKMTIKVFFKYLRILQIKKITIAVTVTTVRDKVVTVSEEINMAVRTQPGEEHDDD